MREQRYADEANGVTRNNENNPLGASNSGYFRDAAATGNKAGLGRMPGGASSINLSWS